LLLLQGLLLSRLELLLLLKQGTVVHVILHREVVNRGWHEASRATLLMLWRPMDSLLLRGASLPFAGHVRAYLQGIWILDLQGVLLLA
jgi:hypothetical protein